MNRLGYDSIKFPKPGISPLDFIVKSSNVFNLITSLPKVWISTIAPPKMKEELIPGINLFESNEFYGAAGVSAIINNLFNTGLSLSSLKDKSVKLIVNSPKRIYCDYAETANYINKGYVDFDQAISKHFFDDQKHVYLILEVLASSDLKIVFSGKSKNEVSLTATEISHTVTANSKISISSVNENEISFQSQEGAVVFGFKQAEIVYDGGWILDLPKGSGRVFLGGKQQNNNLLQADTKIDFS